MESLGQAIATGIALLAAFSAAVWAASFVWAYQDIRRRTADIYVQLFASLLVLLLGPFGAILYLIMRPAETLDEIHFRKIHAEALLQANIFFLIQLVQGLHYLIHNIYELVVF